MLLSNALAFMALIGSAAAVSIEKRANTVAATTYDYTDSTAMPADCTANPLGGPNAEVYAYDTAVASTATSNLIMLGEDTVNRHIQQIALAIKTDANCGTPVFTVGYCDDVCSSTNFVALQKVVSGTASAFTIAESGTSNCFFAGAAANTLIDIVPFDTRRHAKGATTNKRFALRVSAVTPTDSSTNKCNIEVASKMVAAAAFPTGPLTAIVDQGTETEIINFDENELKDYLDAKRYYWNTVKVQFPISTSAATLPVISLTKSTTSTQFFSGIKYLIQKDGAGCPATFTVAAKVGTTTIPEWSVSTGVGSEHLALRGDVIQGIAYFDHEFVPMADDDYIDLKTEDFSLSISIPATTGVCDFYVHAVFNFEKPEVATTTTVATPIPTQGAGNQQQTTVAAAPSAATTAASTTTTAKPVGATNAAQGPAINVAAGMVAAVAAMLA